MLLHATFKGAIKKGLPAAAGGTLAGPGRTCPKSRDVPPEDELIQPDAESSEEDEPVEPQLTLLVALFTLAASAAIIALCAESMVLSINDVTTPLNSTVSVRIHGPNLASNRRRCRARNRRHGRLQRQDGSRYRRRGWV